MAVKYRVHPEVAYEKVAGRNLLIAYGDALKELPYLREINETGAFYWRLVSESMDTDTMLNCALEEYDAARELLEKGLLVFLKELENEGYIYKTEVL